MWDPSVPKGHLLREAHLVTLSKASAWHMPCFPVLRFVPSRLSHITHRNHVCVRSPAYILLDTGLRGAGTLFVLFAPIIHIC